MKAENFRLGNYLHDRENRICQVTELKPHWDDPRRFSFEAPAINGPLTGLPHKPIEFNEKWRKRCLLNDGGIGVHNDRFSGFITVKQITTINYWVFCVGNVELKLFRHVHELQNLFFTLTDEELVIM